MKRKALLIGINYPGTSSQLRGCINDVLNTKELLIDRFDFTNDDITILTDREATAANMHAALDELTSNVNPGDIIYFHYSGHGSQMYDRTSQEADGLDEILCPIDLDWRTKVIRDNDLKRYFDRVPRGAHFTAVLDCCNSGTGMDQQGQYQPEIIGERVVERQSDDIVDRYIPMPAEMQEQARKHKAKQHKMSDVVINRSVDDAGLLITGCRDDQTSADARIGGKYVGACTYFLIHTIKQYDGNISYQRLVEQLNQRMIQHGFTQRPELNGPAFKYGLRFLKPYQQPLHENDPRPVQGARIQKDNWLVRLLQFIKQIFS